MQRDSNSVVLVLIDGMRPDGLRKSTTPVMDNLIATGSSSFRARSVMPTITLPCITSLFHSNTSETHGIDRNKWTPAADMPPSLFSIVRSKERKTASICNWEELRDLSPVGSLDMSVYIDNSYDAGGTGDRFIAELAAEAIRRERFTFTFVYLGHVDVAGHEHGYMSDEYLAAISAADASLGVLLKSLDENTITIVVADHGGHDKGHGSDCDEDMLIPIMINGLGIPQNKTIDSDVSLLDIAPTIAALLQIDPPEGMVGNPDTVVGHPCRMTLTAILLLTVAAALHASWNLISKRGRPSTAFMLIATLMGSLMLAPVAIVYARQYALFSSHIWMLVVITGVFQAVYFAALAGAYRAGDMSLAYPLARSSPVIVVMVVTFMLGQGDEISRSCALGVVLVVAGCFMVPMKTFRDFRLKNYLCRTCALALLAAIGTAGYSIVDSEALQSLRTRLMEADSVVVITLLYALVEALSASVFMLLYVAARRGERVEFVNVLKKEKRRAILAGLCIYLTYSLVLISMSMARNVSYVVGFRQLSIPLGVLMGIVFLKEPLTRPKVLGVVVLVVGLVLIAIG